MNLSLRSLALRPMQHADIAVVALLEREAFPEMKSGTPFTRELKNHLCHYLVACLPRDEGAAESIVGYSGLWFVLDEAHLTTLAVAEPWRRQGIGKHLLLAAIDAALARQSTLMTLEVRESNQSAQALYEQFGFRTVGVRRHYYTDNRENALLMTVEGLDAPEFRERLMALKAALPLPQP